MIGGGTFTHSMGGGLFLFPTPVGSEYELTGIARRFFPQVGVVAMGNSLIGKAQTDFGLTYKIQQAQ